MIFVLEGHQVAAEHVPLSAQPALVMFHRWNGRSLDATPPDMWHGSWSGRGPRSMVVVAALAAGLGVTVSRPAWAGCLAPAPGLLWSYPANGAVEVPVDADLFVSGELFGLPTLAGEPLARIAAGVYELGPLQPQTRYEVRWEDAGAVVAFTTGDAGSPLQSEPSSDVLVTRNPVDFARCPLVLPQGCFDNGRRTRVRFDVGPARAWLLDVLSCDGTVRQMLWPSVCGAPVIESEDPILCMSARGTQGAGFSESTGTICSAPDVPPGTLPRLGGCQGAWPPASALTLVADDVVTLGSTSGLEPQPPTEDVDGEAGAVDGAPVEPGGGCTLSPRKSPAGAIEALAGASIAALLAFACRRARA